MSQVSPYLIFHGECEEALKFYCQTLGGKIQFLTKYKDSPPHWQDKVIHAGISVFGCQIMLADGLPDHYASIGNNINISINFEKKEGKNMDDLFQKLGQGGSITTPLEDTYWGARFGQLVDRFGVCWMFNKELETKKS
jgi:PhnB protein